MVGEREMYKQVGSTNVGASTSVFVLFFGVAFYCVIGLGALSNTKFYVTFKIQY